ncbi:MAG: GNAT family N-acetyltransferase [Blastocatellales bacterium]
MTELAIEILRGQDAAIRLSDQAFLDDWHRLLQTCPWASAYQSEQFVTTWYRTYSADFEPLIAVGRTQTGGIEGLFFLAVDRSDGQLTVAGASHAEYQAWLADASNGESFIVAAIRRLAEMFPDGKLTLLFVLPETPIDWARPDGALSDHCYIRNFKRGLLDIGDGATLSEILRKKLQNKVNRLKRQGSLTFERVTSPEAFSSLFDQFNLFQNLRLKAVYNLPGGDTDGLRKPFYDGLFRSTDLIDATALRLDGRPISIQIHLRNNDQLVLGLISHSPFHARYSPGAIHLAMLGMRLAEDRVPVFDLTPGGDYKDRYATHHDEVCVINIFFSRKDAGNYASKVKAREFFKTLLERNGISFSGIKKRYLEYLDAARKWRELGASNALKGLFQAAMGGIRSRKQVRLYESEPGAKPAGSVGGLLKMDSLEDLLFYRPVDYRSMPVCGYLRHAMRLIEDGGHFFTHVRNGELGFLGWLIGNGRHNDNDWILGEYLDQGQVVVATDIQCRPDAVESFRQFIAAAMEESNRSGNRLVFALPAERPDLIAAAEDQGLVLKKTGLRLVRLGRESVSFNPATLDNR